MGVEVVHITADGKEVDEITDIDKTQVETDPKKRVDISKIMLSFLNSYYPKKASFEK